MYPTDKEAAKELAALLAPFGPERDELLQLLLKMLPAVLLLLNDLQKAATSRN